MITAYNKVLNDTKVMPLNSVTSYSLKQFNLTMSELSNIQKIAKNDDISVIFTKQGDKLLMKVVG